MSAVRQPGKINEHTTLIDIGMYGVAGAAAVYVIEGDKKCLIDAGTRTEASRLVRTLRALDAFPPDIIIATHAHYDHAQGLPVLRKAAAREGKSIEVLAFQKTIPLLADQSYNKDFDAGPYESIQDVAPLEEGDTVDLGGITLRIYEIPGHSADQIASLDEQNRNIFVADGIGHKVADHTYLPAFMPPSWDPDVFLASINKLKQIDYESICISHFGYIYGDEAKTVLDEAVLTCETWWRLFEKNADKLDDVDYMFEAVMREIKLDIPEIRLLSLKLKLLYALMSGWGRLFRRRPRPIGELLLRRILEQLAAGYWAYEKP
jgi:glyoxylase-like metal-dependent hydrolase (beta-lactamase superfamily II)